MLSIHIIILMYQSFFLHERIYQYQSKNFRLKTSVFSLSLSLLFTCIQVYIYYLSVSSPMQSCTSILSICFWKLIMKSFKYEFYWPEETSYCKIHCIITNKFIFYKYMGMFRQCYQNTIIMLYKKKNQVLILEYNRIIMMHF